MRLSWAKILLISVSCGVALILVLFAMRPRAAFAPTSPQTATALPQPTATLAPSTPTASPAPTATPTVTPTPSPTLSVSANASPITITFSLIGEIPSGADEALLWFDATDGYTPRSIALGGAREISATVTITPTEDAWFVDDATSTRLDFWWAVRDTRGETYRQAGSVALPEALVALQQPLPTALPTPLEWEERATPHMRLFAVPNSAAARDLDRIAVVAEESFAQASRVISTTEPISISIYLLPRVFWQGGVAYNNGQLLINYLDRNYIGVELWSYLVHELTHALGAALLPQDREVGGLLGEGAAVYAAGGHYGIVPIDAWAAALAQSERYVPLCELRYDFYAAQHEVAYQEGASFTGFLIRRYGLETFREIYAAQLPQRGGHDVDVATFCERDRQQVIEPTGRTLEELEQDWLAELATIQPTDEQRQAWELTVRFFDTMRSYQEAFDPAARELPPPPQRWDEASKRLFLQTASGPRAVLLETMLGAVQPALRRGELDRAAALLDAIEASLAEDGAATLPLARDYQALIAQIEAQARALRLGDEAGLAATLAQPELAAQLPATTEELLAELRFTPMQIAISGDSAEAVIQVERRGLTDEVQPERALYQATFERKEGGWRLQTWQSYQPHVNSPQQPN